MEFLKLYYTTKKDYLFLHNKNIGGRIIKKLFQFWFPRLVSRLTS